MFAVVYGLFRLITGAIYDINYETDRINTKNKSLQEGKDYYFDASGVMWYCGNGHDEKCSELYNHNPYTLKHDSKNGHHVLVSLKNGTILKDYTVEQNIREENEFLNRYNDSKNNAILNGRKYFCVPGISALDKRYGHYETNGEKIYTLNKIIGYKMSKHLTKEITYYKQYYNGRSKTDIGTKISIQISKQEYEDLGGDSVMNHYTKRVKGYKASYQSDLY